MRRLVAWVAAAAALCLPEMAGALATSAGASAAAGVVPAASGAALSPLHLLARHDGRQSSANWAGYAVEHPVAPVTAVSARFVQPAAGIDPPGFTAIWTGIGGVRSQDLIQAGTAVNPPPFAPAYYAWIELLPDTEQEITGCVGDPACTVNPGDRMSVAIRQVARDRWTIAISDAGHWSWATTVSYRSSRSSAEWIVEAPTLAYVVQTTMANVGTVLFAGANSFTAGGRTRTIAAGHPDAIDLDNVVRQATPSGLARDGRTFAVCSYSSSCPRPAGS